ncbi:MAG: MBL fold metallo-hydrolase [Trueperaceae bacterium]|nr:MBL fold metallo-hydrolase [Trueperaceae bacterium]
MTDGDRPAEGAALHVEAIPVGPIATNAYLVGDPDTHDAVLVDPGAEPERLLARLRQGGWRLREIWITHAHFDHVTAVDAIVAAVGDLPVRLHAADRELYAASAALALRFGGLVVDQPRTPTLDLAHGDVLEAGTVRATVRYVPGHAPGHVVFVLDGVGAVLAGDTLFQGGIGRTDLPFGDHALLLAGIRRELFSLPPDTIVWPGHGPATTVGAELAANPFFAR